MQLQIDLKQNNKSFSKNYTQDTNALLFKIEEMPLSMGIIEKFKFKRMINKSINGYVLAKFEVNQYIVILYSLDKYSKNHTHFIKKIKFLQSLVKDNIQNELWIIHDRNFLCIGILHGAPIFIRIFDSLQDVNDNIALMIRGVNSFGIAQHMRFFCCNACDFEDNGLNIFEYSDAFMTNIMDGHASLSQFIATTSAQPILSYSIVRDISISVSFCVLGCVLLAFRQHLAQRVIYMQNELFRFNTAKIPTKNHYDAIMKLLSS